MQVFLLTQKSGNLYRFDQADDVFIPIYFELSHAKKEQKLLSERIDDKTDVLIKTFGLGSVYSMADQWRKNFKDEGKSLSLPAYVSEIDMEKAKELMRAQGTSEDLIKLALKIPIFSTNPMINFTDSAGTKKVFFTNYAQMKAAIQKLPASVRATLIERAVDLSEVLKIIELTDEDVFVFYPSPDSSTSAN